MIKLSFVAIRSNATYSATVGTRIYLCEIKWPDVVIIPLRWVGKTFPCGWNGALALSRCAKAPVSLLERCFCPWFLKNDVDSKDIEVIENGVSWLCSGDPLPTLCVKGLTRLTWVR